MLDLTPPFNLLEIGDFTQLQASGHCLPFKNIYSIPLDLKKGMEKGTVLHSLTKQ